MITYPKDKQKQRELMTHSRVTLHFEKKTYLIKTESHGIYLQDKTNDYISEGEQRELMTHSPMKGEDGLNKGTYKKTQTTFKIINNK